MPGMLPLSAIIVDPEIQPREKLDNNALIEYIDVLNHGGSLPPIDVFEVLGGYLVADGFHRYEAHDRVGKPEIAVNIIEGTRRDAILYAMSANLKHGIRLTTADKKRMATRLLKDPEWGQYSAVKIAAMVGATQPTVSTLRNELIAAGELEAKPIKVERGGETYEYKGKGKSERDVEQTTLQLVPDVVPEPDEAAADEDSTTDESEQALIDVQVRPYIEVKPVAPDRLLQLSAPKYGDVYSCDRHTLYFNSLGKVVKKLKEFDYCLWFDTLEKLKEQSAWLYDHVGVVSVLTRYGAEIRSFDQLGLNWQSGTLVNFLNRAHFLGHFSIEHTALSEYGASTGEMLIDEPIKKLTQAGSSILVVQPPEFAVLPYLHAHDRTTTIVTTNATYAQKELVNWEELYGDTLPVKKR